MICVDDKIASTVEDDVATIYTCDENLIESLEIYAIKHQLQYSISADPSDMWIMTISPSDLERFQWHFEFE